MTWNTRHSRTDESPFTTCDNPNTTTPHYEHISHIAQPRTTHTTPHAHTSPPSHPTHNTHYHNYTTLHPTPRIPPVHAHLWLDWMLASTPPHSTHGIPHHTTPQSHPTPPHSTHNTHTTHLHCRLHSTKATDRITGQKKELPLDHC